MRRLLPFLLAFSLAMIASLDAAKAQPSSGTPTTNAATPAGDGLHGTIKVNGNRLLVWLDEGICCSIRRQ